MTEALLKYENVKVFCFQSETDITNNLDYYMDTIHFSPEINRRMLDHIIAGEYEVTQENYSEVFEAVRDYCNDVQDIYIKPYEEDGKLNYVEE